MTGKKIIAFASAVVLAVSVVVVASPVSAQTSSDYEELTKEELIELLLSMIEDEGDTGVSGDVPAECEGVTFERSLSTGDTGDDVLCLQALLNSNCGELDGITVASSGPGAPGSETSYYGPLTRAAVVHFQEAYTEDVLGPWGLTTGTGYFGETSRAKANELLTSCEGEEPTPEDCADYEEEATCEDAGCYWYDDSCNAEEEEITGEGLNVELSASTPEAGYVLVDSSSGVFEHQKEMVRYDFEAGEDTTVEEITFTRGGFVTDGDISEMYLYVDGELVDTTPSNIATKKFKFSTPFDVEAGETAHISLRADLDSGATTASVVNFGLASADDIDAGDVEVSGDFPLNGNSMSVADVTLAATTITTETTGDGIKVGEDDKELAKVDVTVSNNDVVVEDMIFTVVGSLSSSDLSNFELRKDSGEVVGTVDSMTSEKRVAFMGVDLELDSNETYYIYGDAEGGANRTFDFTGDRAVYFTVIDQEQDVRVAPLVTDTGGDEGTIAAGSFVVENATDAPLGGVPDGETDVTLAKYDFTAGGERVKVTSIELQNAVGGGNADLVNVKILVDGSQKGSTYDIADDATQEFTFGNSFTISLGSTATVEVVGDLTDSSVDSSDEFYIDTNGDGITYDLLDSNTTEQTIDLPTGYRLVPTSVTLDAAISGDSPDSQIVPMNDTVEIGRWELEPDAGDVEVRDLKFTNSLGFADFTGNVSSATVRLYKDGSEVASSTRSVKDTDVWFGNDADKTNNGTYYATSNLDWDLEDGEVYELALEYAFSKDATGSSGSTSGDTNAATFATVTYHDGSTEQADQAVGEAAQTMELRKAVASMVDTTGTQTSTLYGNVAEELMSLTLSETSGINRYSAKGITVDVTADQTITGDNRLILRKGGSTGSIVAKLENATPDNLGITSVTDGTDNVEFTNDHGLDIGDVFEIDTDDADGGSDDADTDVVVIERVDSTNVIVANLDGSSVDLSDTDIGDDAAAGSTVFLEESTLYIPFLTQSDSRISAGSSQTFVMYGNATSGGWTSDDQLRLLMDDATDLEWFDETIDENWTDDSFTSTYVNGTPIQSTLTY